MPSRTYQVLNTGLSRIFHHVRISVLCSQARAARATGGAPHSVQISTKRPHSLKWLLYRCNFLIRSELEIVYTNICSRLPNPCSLPCGATVCMRSSMIARRIKNRLSKQQLHFIRNALKAQQWAQWMSECQYMMYWHSGAGCLLHPLMYVQACSS